MRPRTTARRDQVVFRVGAVRPIWALRPTRPPSAPGRYDDAMLRAQVRYGASTRLGAIIEVLAQFLPDLTIPTLAGEGDIPTLTPGIVPKAWFSNQWVGRAEVTGRFVDLGKAETLACLRPLVDPLLRLHGARTLDASVIRGAAPRVATQAIAAICLDERTPAGGHRYDGIKYLSRWGDDVTCWGVFDHVRAVNPRSTPLSSDDRDVDEALEILGLFVR
jgi:RES domain